MATNICYCCVMVVHECNKKLLKERLNMLWLYIVISLTVLVYLTSDTGAVIATFSIGLFISGFIKAKKFPV